MIEHGPEQRRHLREIDRIAAPTAPFALATPNRFSVSAEPHVGVWGVGWLPARWQQRYVHMRSGKSYDFVRLLSVPGLKRLMKRETHFDGRVIVPPIAEEEIELFADGRATTIAWPSIGCCAGRCSPSLPSFVSSACDAATDRAAPRAGRRRSACRSAATTTRARRRARRSPRRIAIPRTHPRRAATDTRRS